MAVALSLEDLEYAAEELASVDQAREHLAVLEDYYARIAATGGVSRSQAKALVADCGIQLSERYPEASFTEVPSSTNLTITMEGIVGAAAKALMELIKKAAELLIKLVRWCIDSIKGQRAEARQLATMQNNVEVVSEGNEKLRTSGITKGVLPANAPPSSLTEAYDKHKQAEELYLDHFSDMTGDLLQGGPMGNAVRQLSLAIVGILPKLDSKMKLFDKVLTSHQGTDTNAEMTQISELRAIATPIDAGVFARVLARSPVSTKLTASSTFAETLSTVRDHVREMCEVRTGEPMAMDLAVKQVANPARGFAAPFVVITDHVRQQMESYETDLRRVQNTQPSHQATDEIRKAYADAVSSIASEVMGLRDFFVAVKWCTLTQQRLMHDTLAYESALYEVNRLIAEASDDKEQMQTLADVTNEMNHRLKKF